MAADVKQYETVLQTVHGLNAVIWNEQHSCATWKWWTSWNEGTLQHQ